MENKFLKIIVKHFDIKMVKNHGLKQSCKYLAIGLIITCTPNYNYSIINS